MHCVNILAACEFVICLSGAFMPSSQNSGPTRPVPRLNRRRLLRLAASGIVTILIVILLWMPTWRREKKTRMTITAGSSAGLRHAIAESLARYSAPQHVEVVVEPTDGSREALSMVNAGDIDLALIQGGLLHDEYPNIRQVAVLQLEPLHLLCRFDDKDMGSVDRLTLSDLSPRISGNRKLTINLSTPNSGTNALSTEVLRFFGLSKNEDYIATQWKYSELLDPEFPDENLPDAVFTVSSLPSPVAKFLITRRGYRPVELPMSDAFRIDWTPRVSSADGRAVVRQYVQQAKIPAFTYQVSPPVPRQELVTLGTRLHLVAHAGTPADAVERVVDAVYDSSFAAISDPPLSVTLLRSAAEFELHDGAASYLEKKTPIITENVVALTEQLLAIMGTVCGGLLFVWQGILFVRRRRRDRQFLACIERVGQIEQRTLEFENDDSMTVDSLLRLQSELQKIKSDMVRQFQRGDIDGADTLSSFLMHVNDANENLTRMILHERSPRDL